MGKTLTRSKRFRPGTTGWTADDLDNPRNEARWGAGRFEIINGVLTTMPAAYFEGGATIMRLVRQMIPHLDGRAIPGDFSPEVDIVIDPTRVVRADLVFMTPEDQRRQRAAAVAAGRPDPYRTRVLVPPTLVIESESPGHEFHDEHTKRRWYAEFGVPHYWLLHPLNRTLRCLALRGTVYVDDVSGRDSQTVRPSAFPGLAIALQNVWPK